MNFYEQELKKIMENSEVLKNQQYVGRKCYGVVDSDIRGCVEFVTLGVSNQYAGIRASLINRKEGQIDSVLIKFSDLFGKKKVQNPNFKDGIVPHIWEKDGKPEWYVYQASEKDYKQLMGAVENYLGVFQEEVMEQTGNSGGMQQMI